MYNEWVDMMKKTDKEKRDAEIQLWFSQGLSQVDIAGRLSITRQRVQQIEQSLGISRERIYEKKEYDIVCTTCEKEFTTNKKDRKFCCRECFRKSRIKKLTKKELEERDTIRREKNRLKAKEYYHNVFKKRTDWKEIIKKRNKEQYATQSSNKP